jgi:hypothetical protein
MVRHRHLSTDPGTKWQFILEYARFSLNLGATRFPQLLHEPALSRLQTRVAQLVHNRWESTSQRGLFVMKTEISLRHEFVEFIPEVLAEKIVYVSVRFATAVHKCCCRCGREVVTPLTPTDWKLIFDGKTVSLDPSIGSWSFPCKSHYWIENDTSFLRLHPFSCFPIRSFAQPRRLEGVDSGVRCACKRMRPCDEDGRRI